MIPGEPAAESTPASGWTWVARLGGFAAAFTGGLLLLGGVLGWLGAPATTDLSAWNVIPAVAVAVATSWWFTRFEGRPLSSLGLPAGARTFSELGWGTLVGVVLIGTVVIALVVLGWLAWYAEPAGASPAGAALALTSLLLGAAFVEELLFRGYPFQVIERRFGAVTAIAVTSVTFGALHAANPNFAALPAINITLAGVLLAVAYWRTRSLWFATGLHLGWNLTMAVSELSVSGLPIEMPGYEPRVSGPAVWTGGGFGPEGGLLVTLVTLAGIVWMWRWAAEGVSLSRPSGPRTGPGIRRKDAGVDRSG